MLLRLYKLIFILIIVILSSLGMQNYAKADEIENDIKKFIGSYFDEQYQCLSSLEQRDLREFYYTKSMEGEKAYIIDREALSYIIGCRSMQANDLRLRNYKFELDYKVIQIKVDVAHIALVENSEFQFNFLKDIPTKKHNIEHKFELMKSDNGWKIVSHDSSEDEFRIIRDGIQQYRSHEGIKDFYLDLMRKSMENEKKNEKIRDRKSDQEELRREKEETIQSSSGGNNVNLNPYDREKAVEYAYSWSQNGEKLRNSPPWGNYDAPMGDGDCTNFVSQCIYAGGIPMDYKGKEYEQWKWYNNSYNAAPVPKGRVASWTGVEALYNYCKLNSGYGMSAVAGSQWGDLHIGDVVQFGKNEDNYFHSVIITGYVYDDEDTLKDFLISSHTTDRHNYPLSAYSYPLRRYIHIKGRET